MKNTKLIVKTKSKSYPIYFGNNILNTTGKLIKKNLPNVKKICIISDNKLPKFLIPSLSSYAISREVKKHISPEKQPIYVKHTISFFSSIKKIT